MPITLRFQSSGAIPGSGEPVTMHGDSLTIGRGPENDLVLPDADRMISKRHCVLEEHGRRIVLIDISTNGTFLNYAKEPAGAGPTEVRDGDVLSLGSYEFVIEISDGQAPTIPDHPRAIDPDFEPRARVGGVAPLPEETGFLDDRKGSGDFLEDLLGGSPTVSGSHQLIPEDPLDFAGPHFGDDDILGADRDDPAGDVSRSEADHGAAAHDAFSPPPATGAFIPDDWDLEGVEPAEASAAPRAPESERPLPAESGPAPTPPAVSADAASLAFLKAAGIDARSIPAEELETTMGRAGTVMLALISGIREVLMTRAAIKTEFRMKQTVVRAGDNNPLKFSVSAAQAMEAMLRPPTPGYLEPVRAASEALRDVKAHEAAMLAGLEAALKGVLERLDPAALEARIETGGGLTGLLKGRKARYWEVYEKLYAEISDEVENDFHELFSKEFARAYQEQVDRL